ncbi:tRNA (guanosine(37)-N1)-methyltransferase TrmD [Candidatus Parcubacteria bacterium]|nr:MAG: tRNA (guanosine(37)-N1)-methyltransferase TrmD [Candidatus Parcubacteria bacterium]
MIQFDIITIFPKLFCATGKGYENGSCCYFDYGILRRALKKGLIKIHAHDLRKYTNDRHKSVDDRPFGGGPGMILKAEPIYKAINEIERKVIKRYRGKAKKSKMRIIMLAPEGKTFNQKEAKRLSKYDQLVLLCGRYEGFDSRVEKFVDEKISVGNFILAGGELAAMTIMEAVSRHIKGVVGHEHALDEETFCKDLDYVEYPQYTRPEVFKWQTANGKRQTVKVPEVLLSGNHQKIHEWRQKHQRKKK